MNLVYNCKSKKQKTIDKFKRKSKKQWTQIFIKGKKILCRQDKNKQIQDIIWITYRKSANFSNGFTSDVGWGCMIRSGQMLFAQTLKKHFDLKGIKSSKKKLIQSFIEDKNSNYSLSQIAKQKMGQYFYQAQVCQNLSELHKKNPIESSETLKLVHFNNVIFIEDILKVLEIKLCQCYDKKILCQKCHGELYCQEEVPGIQVYQSKLGKSLMKLQQKNFKVSQNHVLLTITFKIGLNKVDQNIYESVLEMMQLPFYQGSLGGSGNKGYYIVGRDNKDLIYLDPHKQKEEVTRKNINLDDFRCHDNFTLGVDQLATTMTLAFYLQNVYDLAQLFQYMSKKQHIPFWYLWKDNQKEVKYEQGQMEQQQTQEFQVLEWK